MCSRNLGLWEIVIQKITRDWLMSGEWVKVLWSMGKKAWQKECRLNGPWVLQRLNLCLPLQSSGIQKNVCVIQLLVSLNTIYTWYIAAQVQHIKQHVKVVRFSPFRCLYEPYFSLPLTTHVGYNASLLSSSLLPLLELSLPTAVNQVHTRPHPSSCPRQKEHLRYFPKECVFPFNHKKTLENTFVIMINKSDLLLLSCCSTIMWLSIGHFIRCVFAENRAHIAARLEILSSLDMHANNLAGLTC